LLQSNFSGLVCTTFLLFLCSALHLTLSSFLTVYCNYFWELSCVCYTVDICLRHVLEKRKKFMGFCCFYCFLFTIHLTGRKENALESIVREAKILCNRLWEVGVWIHLSFYFSYCWL
jgi:hypothetical protein